MRAYSISFAPFPISHEHFFNSPHQSRVPTINDIIFCSLHDHQSTILLNTAHVRELFGTKCCENRDSNISSNFLAIYTHSKNGLRQMRIYRYSNRVWNLFQDTISLPRERYIRDRRKFSIASFPGL